MYGAHPAHRAEGQHRHLSALADRHRDPVPGPVRHRAVHDLGVERHPRRPCVSPGEAEAGCSRNSSKTSYFGFSFGGIITANLANRYRKLHLPKPRAIFLDDPHDGALDGFGEPALDDSLAGIPPTVKLQCHAPRRGRDLRAEPGRTGRKLQRGLPEARAHPEAQQGPRAHPHRRPRHDRRSRACTACAPRAARPGSAANAYDWNFCWKVWDALRSCAYRGRDCRYALGNTRQHRSKGRWSDGVPISAAEDPGRRADPALSVDQARLGC